MSTTQKSTGGSTKTPATGGPAFPTMQCGEDSYGPRASWSDSQGMTLRDHFAGQALVGVLARSQRHNGAADVADVCYDLADAMIARRGK